MEQVLAGHIRRKKPLGWIPSPPDHNDFIYEAPPRGLLPDAVDLRKTGLLGDAWRQKRLGSCQSHAAGKAWEYTLGREGLPQITPSKLFIYYNARAYQGWQDQDNGAYLRDTVKGLAEFGAPPEKYWPYKVGKYAVKPPVDAYRRAEKRVALEYLSVPQDPDGMAIKSSLAESVPVIVGFSIYEGTGMPTERNGWYQPMPEAGARLLNAHSVLVVGYTTLRNKPVWIILDSDGTRDNKGYWYMAHDYLCDQAYSGDFWALRKVGHAG